MNSLISRCLRRHAISPGTSERGAGLLVVLFMLMGLALTASLLTFSMRVAFDDQATTESQKKMRLVAEAISSANFAAGTQLQRHYEQDVGALPSALNDLLTKPAAVGTCYTTTSANGVGGWCGPYLTKKYVGENIFSDGWGTDFVLNTANRHVRSIGPNRADNSGAGDDLVQPF